MESSTTRERLDVTTVSRRFGRHTVTLTRWEREGILPPSHRVGGRRCWYADEVAEAERRIAELELARPMKSRPEAVALAAAGRAARDARRSLRDAAGEALAVGGLALVARVLARFTTTGRLDDIPADRRLEAARALIETARAGEVLG